MVFGLSRITHPLAHQRSEIYQNRNAKNTRATNPYGWTNVLASEADASTGTKSFRFMRFIFPYNRLEHTCVRHATPMRLLTHRMRQTGPRTFHSDRLYFVLPAAGKAYFLRCDKTLHGDSLKFMDQLYIENNDNAK